MVFRLELHVRGAAPRVFSVGARPVLVGRAPSCDLVLAPETVSGRHLSLWESAGGLYVEDLGSRNGTWRDGVRLTGPTRLDHGDTLVLSEDEVRILVLDGAPDEPVVGALVIEDIDGGVGYPVRGQRTSLPQTDGAVLLVMADGELLVGEDGATRPVEPNRLFTAGGRRFRLKAPPDLPSATRELAPSRYPYRLEVTLDGGTGAEARLLDPASGLSHRVLAENRAVLLYVLARRLEEDRDEARPPALAGWCTDDEVITGIWGRDGPKNPVNSLNVLVMRTRRELEGAGFDPWFIEKRSGNLRAQVREVVIL